ncbi:class I SAM-dependent methyltransferase [Phyllobacterium sp. YR531]|uniref:class I SAM-dependent methyltransferase n=1 Tax=Phyllobacterium sp. YR531 TaxID=1144343 RepID=UPI00026F986F|nr:class I SAM-dependent methyltransferase [Phyllobacterium sp. YR531]EJN05341.1 methylase involved in ubiquinone/menaquinone biosynthesis [Phyllobacterium sp. YR531]
MSTASDARFWDRTSSKYAAGKIADQAGYERTLERTLSLLKPTDRVLELGSGTGTTAMRLAGSVQTYLATDISRQMIAIAEEKYAAEPISGLAFRTATAEMITSEDGSFNAILGFNYLHLVRDLPGTLRQIHALLAADGLFVSKTPCVGDMNPLIQLVLPIMRGFGLAPYAGVFKTRDLNKLISAAGFDIVATENHATKGDDNRPYIIARKR